MKFDDIATCDMPYGPFVSRDKYQIYIGFNELTSEVGIVQKRGHYAYTSHAVELFDGRERVFLTLTVDEARIILRGLQEVVPPAADDWHASQDNPTP